MKRKTTSATLFIFLCLTLFYSCNCKSKQSSLDTSTEVYYLNLDCNNQKDYQPLHLDLANGFGILAKIKTTNDTITSLYLKIKEAGSCKRYRIKGAKLVTYGEGMHNIEINVEKDKVAKDSFPFITRFKVAKDDIIDIHIMSKDVRIRSKYLDSSGNYVNPDFIDFGTEFCRSIVILGGE